MEILGLTVGAARAESLARDDRDSYLLIAELGRFLGRFVTPPVTQLHLLRSGGEPGADEGRLGFTVEEMAGIVGGTLRAIGLTGPFAPLVIVAGHGSSSLNNPQEAAHDCGACGGARGGRPGRPTTRSWKGRFMVWSEAATIG